MFNSLYETIFRLFLAILGLIFILYIVAYLVVEILWFQEVGYLSTLILKLTTQFILWVSTFSISLSFLWGNLYLAQKLEWHNVIYNNTQSPSKTHPQSSVIKLNLLLPIVLIFSLLLAFMLLYYGSISLEVWQENFTLPTSKPSLLSPFPIDYDPQKLLSGYGIKMVSILIILTFLLVKTRLSVKAIAVIFSLVFAWVMAGNWTRILEYFNQTAFPVSDPILHHNLSVYIFSLPIWKLIEFCCGGIILGALLSVILIYLLSNNSIAEGKFIGFSRPQLRHVYGLGGMMMFVIACRHWLARYLLLYRQDSVIYGAGYTDTHINLPLETLLAIIALIIALWLLLKAITGSGKKAIAPYPRKKRRFIPFSPVPFYLYFSILIIGFMTSKVVQILIVQPNELEREKPYIEYSINFTRAGFNLTQIEAKTFDPEGSLNEKDIKQNHLTIDNIRLWDSRPIIQTNSQLQQIRLYYKFPDADIDRYTLKVSKQREITTEKVQVLIAPRELDYQDVPERAKTWVNKHLVYTHGYGFTVSPVNRVGEGGLPYYFVDNIGTANDPGALRTSSQLIRDSIPIGKPRIYYGELSNNYVMTSTKMQEFDFPEGEENAYNIYDGAGGIKIGSPWRRFLFAIYLKDWQMLFTKDFTPDTKLLYRRNIKERIKAIAPFLNYDRDPYLVVADSGNIYSLQKHNNLHWFIDGYTINSYYPYSDPGEHQFNYIRNSVKVLIDAYNGNIQFYIADSEDPIVQTWSKIFPQLFKPLEEMPITLRTHIRYPSDFFGVQSERLLTYHMIDPQVFYNREDQWEIPQEIYGNQTEVMSPYYLIMKLPIATQEEFILLHPYSPTSRPNLIAWLAGRSDGKQYGKLLLYQFPKQKLVYGPDQIEALINQDPVISERISLWNRQDSKVIQGNLLVIPIEQSLLYVEPLYLEAEKNGLPTLVRVIVVYENNIVMAETLEEALDALFEPKKLTTPAIIRPVEEVPTIAQ